MCAGIVVLIPGLCLPQGDIGRQEAEDDVLAFCRRSGSTAVLLDQNLLIELALTGPVSVSVGAESTGSARAPESIDIAVRASRHIDGRAQDRERNGDEDRPTPFRHNHSIGAVDEEKQNSCNDISR